MTTDTTVPTVHLAWANVMADVRELAKGDRNAHFNFNFRGIDAVMNAVGPVLRRHQVAVIPTHVVASHRDVQTVKGKPSREATVVVTYTVYGPAGDSFTMQAPGESMDEGDKGTPKAMSVAMRTVLLQSLCLPTQDTDPDADSYQRGTGPTAQQMADQVAEGIGRVQDVPAMRKWCAERELLELPVTDPAGARVTLGSLLDSRATELAKTEAVA